MSNLQDAQLKFLRRVMEVPKSTPIAALFLELGILPIQYEIEKRQLVFLKRILDRENDDPIKMSYHEMLKYQAERNWANNVHELRGKYNLPLNDENVCNLTYATWKKMVHDRVKYVAFASLTEMCSANKKTCLLSYDKLIKAPYLTSFKPEIARMVLRARVGVYHIKECPFCRQSPEEFEHIFKCNSGILCKKSLKGTTLYELVTMKVMQKTKEIGKVLVTYQKYREFFL